MATKINAALDRRAAIRVGAVGAVATAATVAAASNAEAAAGQAVIQGAVNTVGTAGTSLNSSGTAVTLTVKNTGAGAGAFFFAQNNNGFAGGTGAGNKYGLSAANTGAAGGGAAMAASGSKNTGVLANTANSDRFALEAVNLSAPAQGSGEGGGVYAEGGEAPAVVAISDLGIPATITIGDPWLIEGHEVVLMANSFAYGVVSANGAEVTFSGTVDLDAQGEANPTIQELAFDDVDMSASVAFVCPLSGPMPNLWILPMTDAGVKIRGGVPGGSVNYRVIGIRADWTPPFFAPVAGRGPAGADIAKRAAKAAKARAGRD